MKTFVRWAVVIFLLPLSVSCRDTGRATSGGGVKPLLTAIDDLRGKRIAVQFGTVYDMYATKTFPGATVVQFNTFQEVTLAVSAGKVDAGLSDLDTLNEVRRANDDLVPFGKPIFARRWRPDLRNRAWTCARRSAPFSRASARTVR